MILPAEELHLRYVAVTRAQGVCTAPQWLEPTFGDLAEFCRAHPGFVLVGNHTELLSQQVGATEQAPPPQEQVELVGAGQAELVAPPVVSELLGSKEAEQPATVVDPAEQPAIVPSGIVLTPTATSGHAPIPVVPLFSTPQVVLPPATTPPPTAPVNQTEQGGAGGAPGAPSQSTYRWFSGL